MSLGIVVIEGRADGLNLVVGPTLGMLLGCELPVGIMDGCALGIDDGGEDMVGAIEGATLGSEVISTHCPATQRQFSPMDAA